MSAICHAIPFMRPRRGAGSSRLLLLPLLLIAAAPSRVSTTQDCGSPAPPACVCGKQTVFTAIIHTCRAVGDPHYSAFDGSRHDSYSRGLYEHARFTIPPCGCEVVVQHLQSKLLRGYPANAGIAAIAIRVGDTTFTIATGMYGGTTYGDEVIVTRPNEPESRLQATSSVTVWPFGYTYLVFEPYQGKSAWRVVLPANAGSYYVYPRKTHWTASGRMYHTWLKVSSEVIAGATGLCTTGCKTSFIPVLPSTACSGLTYDEHCYPVRDEDLVFPADLLRELEPPNNIPVSGSTRACPCQACPVGTVCSSAPSPAPSAVSTISGDCIIADKFYRGIIQRGMLVTSALECQQACAAHALCNFWDYDGADQYYRGQYYQYCRLRSDDGMDKGDMIPTAGCTAGPKLCVPAGADATLAPSPAATAAPTSPPVASCVPGATVPNIWFDAVLARGPAPQALSDCAPWCEAFVDSDGGQPGVAKDVEMLFLIFQNVRHIVSGQLGPRTVWVQFRAVRFGIHGLMGDDWGNFPGGAAITDASVERRQVLPTTFRLCPDAALSAWEMGWHWRVPC